MIRFLLEALVVFVVARVLRGATILNFDNLLADCIQELRLVRNTDDRAVVIRDVIVHQPILGSHIEVVRRFVKEQEVRLLQQQLCHRNTHLPASRKCIREPVNRIQIESKTSKNTADTGIYGVCIRPH